MNLAKHIEQHSESSCMFLEKEPDLDEESP